MSVVSPHGQLAYPALEEELTQIYAHHYPEQGRWKEYYAAIVDCLRHYLAQQYHIHLESRSVRELQRALRHAPLAAEQTQALLDLFAENEAVQMSHYLPGLGQGRQLIEYIRFLVTQLESSRQASLDQALA